MIILRKCMAKIENDKYYISQEIVEKCIVLIRECFGDKDWKRVIDPSVGGGAFLPYLPKDTICFDIAPNSNVPQTIQQDFREVKLPYISESIVIGNPPFGRANKMSVQFVKKAMELGDYCAFIQPISQLEQNRTMKDTELLLSEDLGKTLYSGKSIHCCFNIYHKKIDGHKENFDIPEILECRHIFRSGKFQHSDKILNYPWNFRVAAWGDIHLLKENEQCPNEVVFRTKESINIWLKEKLELCLYKELISCVSTPNLPAWLLRKWLYKEYKKEVLDESRKQQSL